MASQYANEIGALFIETSAKSNTNVAKVSARPSVPLSRQHSQHFPPVNHLPSLTSLTSTTMYAPRYITPPGTSHQRVSTPVNDSSPSAPAAHPLHPRHSSRSAHD